MQKSTLLTVFLSLVLVVAAGFGLSAITSKPAAAENTNNYMNFSQQNIGIWVTGQGKVMVVPDIAVITMGVEAQATTVNDAQQQAATSMADLMAVLDNAGINKKDITTSYYNIQPVYTWDESQRISVIIGYRVSNTASVKIRQIEETGSIIDQVVVATGDNVRINDLYFTVDNPDQYYDTARENAMNDARSKAEQMASLGGVQLGKPTYISEGSTYYPPVIRYAGQSKESDNSAVPTTPINPGETTISMSIQVVYSIQ